MYSIARWCVGHVFSQLYSPRVWNTIQSLAKKFVMKFGGMIKGGGQRQWLLNSYLIDVAAGSVE